MGTHEALAQTRIQKRLEKAHGYLISAAQLAADDDNPFTLDDVERLKSLAEQVKLALADLCGVVGEQSCI